MILEEDWSPFNAADNDMLHQTWDIYARMSWHEIKITKEFVFFNNVHFLFLQVLPIHDRVRRKTPPKGSANDLVQVLGADTGPGPLAAEIASVDPPPGVKRSGRHNAPPRVRSR